MSALLFVLLLIVWPGFRHIMLGAGAVCLAGLAVTGLLVAISGVLS